MPELRDKVEVVVGSLQDYFAVHADIVFLNTGRIAQTLCDEGVFISLAFYLSRLMLPGSLLVILTSLDNLSSLDFGSDCSQEASFEFGSNESMMYLYMFRTTSNIK